MVLYRSTIIFSKFSVIDYPFKWFNLIHLRKCGVDHFIVKLFGVWTCPNFYPVAHNQHIDAIAACPFCKRIVCESIKWKQNLEMYPVWTCDTSIVYSCVTRHSFATNMCWERESTVLRKSFGCGWWIFYWVWKTWKKWDAYFTFWLKVGLLLSAFLLLGVIAESNLNHGVKSIYIYVYYKVAKRFISVLCTFLPLLIAFVLAFQIIFGKVREIILYLK